jgi:hypothetical protein
MRKKELTTLSSKHKTGDDSVAIFCFVQGGDYF